MYNCFDGLESVKSGICKFKSEMCACVLQFIQPGAATLCATAECYWNINYPDTGLSPQPER